MDMGQGKVGLSKKYILKAVDDSLKRLQTDYIDLYQSHKDDEQTSVEETLEAFQILIKAGKVRFIGASNFSKNRLAEAISASEKYSLPRYESLQPHYNLLERKEFETNLEGLCLEKRIGVINYFPLASGFLSGKYRGKEDLNKSIRGGGVSKYMNKKGFSILTTIDLLAKKHASKPASIAIAWYLARPSVTSPIASATSPEQLKDLMQGLNIKLDNEDIQQLDLCSVY
jgi:aryl-alcohol dehydrogenase-like predicted oxidoreductase